MAAAVPVPLCEKGARLDRSPADGPHHVYYSRRDGALRRAFDAGQFVYGEPGAAVGLEGAPESRWSTSTSTGYKHGGYWPTYEVAGDVAGHLGPAGERPAQVRFLPTWDLQDLWDEIDEVEPSQREIAERGDGWSQAGQPGGPEPRPRVGP